MLEPKQTEMLSDDDITIIDYDLGAEEGIIDHDQVCVAQATKLLQIGYLEYETALYGSAYCSNDGEIYYYISAKESTMEKFLHYCYQNNIYPTPAQYFCKRYDLVSETEESIKARFRLKTAFDLRKTYPPLLFEALTMLTKNDCANSAFPIMKELSQQLESCFDLNQLSLFGNLTEMLFQGRLLSKESYLLLNQWLTKEQEKIAAEPIASGDYCRTYSGFAYQKADGKIRYFIDAFPYMAREKQTAYIAQGYLVTPLLTITYYADNFNNLQKTARATFQSEIEKYLNEMYLKLMTALRNLPAAVDARLYLTYFEQIKAAGNKKALEAYCYYGHLWNALH